VFILNMGEPVKIIDLARKMISFAKNGQAATIPIAFTGMRPGERMHELLVGSQETSGPTDHPLIDVLLPTPESAGEIGPGHAGYRDRIETLLALGQAHMDRAAVIQALRGFLPTYQPFSMKDAEGPFVLSGNGHAAVVQVAPVASDILVAPVRRRPVAAA